MLQLTISQCRPEDAEQVSLFLEETGALSVTMTDEYDDAILEPELGTHPLWPHVIVEALFSEKTDAQHAVDTLAHQFSHLEFTIADLPEQDWERACMQDFKPLRFGERLWVCPSWITPPDPSAINLILDPGLAFGTGTHQTTSLCLQWLEQANLDQLNVIDYGCGSGILALAALKLGAKHVYAVDIDEQALIATRSNAANNKLTQQLTVSPPEQLKIEADVLIANILLSPLLTLKKSFKQLLKENGTLVVSGLLAEQEEELIEEYQDTFTHCSTLINEEWALLVFRPKK